jgi:hypothetical protein
MYVKQDYDPLDVALESDIFSMNFAAILGVGETISSVVTSLVVIQGSDPAAGSRLSGSPGVSGSICSQLVDVRGLAASVRYRLTFVITTSLRPAVARWSNFWAEVPPVGP